MVSNGDDSPPPYLSPNLQIKMPKRKSRVEIGLFNTLQKSYLRSEHLKNHQLSHDPLAHPFVCAFERCGQKFSAKSSLYVHLKRHPQQAGLLQGRLRCLLDACDGAFLYKKDLQASRLRDVHS